MLQLKHLDLALRGQIINGLYAVPLELKMRWEAMHAFNTIHITIFAKSSVK